MSLVEVQPSTVMALKLSATPARSDLRELGRASTVGVGGEHGEHRGHVGGEHRGALGHAADDEARRPGPRPPCGAVSVVRMASAAAVPPVRVARAPGHEAGHARAGWPPSAAGSR